MKVMTLTCFSADSLVQILGSEDDDTEFLGVMTIAK